MIVKSKINHFKNYVKESLKFKSSFKEHRSLINEGNGLIENIQPLGLEVTATSTLQ